MSRLDKPIFLPFEKWSPDMPEWRNTGAIVARNVIARNGFYAPLRKPVIMSGAVASAVLGSAATIRSVDASVFNYVGTSSKLYEMSGSLGWTDRTRLVGGDYTVATTDRWEFAQFGETLLAVDGWTDTLQFIVLGGANFADMPTAPKARHIAIIGNFVVLGNTIDLLDGARTHRMWWSGFNDASDWTPNLATQCSFRDLVGSGGSIQRVIGGEYGVILRQRSLARMSYIGPPGVFQFDEIEDSHGTDTPWSAVKYGRVTYYHSDDGWYAFDGAQSSPIGRDSIDETFKADFQSAYAENLVGCVDPVSKLIHWIYPGAGANGGLPNRDLILNPTNGQFTLAEFENEFVGAVYSSIPTTTDSVDAIYANTDSLVGFTDDASFSGGGLQLGFFDPEHRVTLLNGSNQPARIDTGERQLNPAGRTFVEGLKPMLDADVGVTVTALERDTTARSVTIGESDTIDVLGEAHPRSDSRYHRFRVDIAENTVWSKADGIYITEAENSGVA